MRSLNSRSRQQIDKKEAPFETFEYLHVGLPSRQAPVMLHRRNSILKNENVFAENQSGAEVLEEDISFDEKMSIFIGGSQDTK